MGVGDQTKARMKLASRYKVGLKDLDFLLTDRLSSHSIAVARPGISEPENFVYVSHLVSLSLKAVYVFYVPAHGSSQS